MKKILVTGGAGFIGANFLKVLLRGAEEMTVFNFDKLTYAGDLKRLGDVEHDGRYFFIKGDISDKVAVEDVFSRGLDAVVHFAAESHVDRSIEDASPFEETNVRGTLTLLDAARKFRAGKFIHISTDEVYGALGESGEFFESTPLNPSSPYSASKAAADMFVKAYHHTYKLPAIIVRPSNNYGPWQYPEKLIPVVIGRALEDKPVPVYAKGENIREWLYVEDCAEGIIRVMEKGKIGEIYNLGSGYEKRNIDVVKKILSILGKPEPEAYIAYVADRPGHDFRYRLNSEKIKKELGFTPKTGFDGGIEKTVRWYVDNQQWLKGHLKN